MSADTRRWCIANGRTENHNSQTLRFDWEALLKNAMSFHDSYFLFCLKSQSLSISLSWVDFALSTGCEGILPNSSRWKTFKFIVETVRPANKGEKELQNSATIQVLIRLMPQAGLQWPQERVELQVTEHSRRRVQRTHSDLRSQSPSTFSMFSNNLSANSKDPRTCRRYLKQWKNGRTVH